MSERMMRTVFDWEHFAVYLSGSMDFAEDGGKGWREEWTKRLVDIGMNPKQIYNPCKKPFHNDQFDLDDEHAIGQECRAKGDWKRFYDVMGQIMHIDLRLVDKADIILVNMPKVGWDNPLVLKATRYYEEGLQLHGSRCAKGYPVLNLARAYAESRIPTYGTIHEIVVAHMQRKPIFLVWEGSGLKGCSAWLMRLVGYQNVFSHVDSLIDNLAAISQGKQAFDANEWLLIEPK